MNQLYPYLSFQMKPSFKILWISILFLFSFSAFADNAKEGMRLFEARKYQQAMTYFMKPDAQKNPEVINRIAYMYDYGLGVEKTGKSVFNGIKKQLRWDLLQRSLI